MHHTYHTLSDHFGRTQWYSLVMKLNRKLVSVRLEIVLILTQDRYMVCAEHTIDSEIVLHAPDGKLLGDLGHVESCSVHLEMVLVLVQDRCTVCTKRTIGSDIILDALDGTLR